MEWLKKLETNRKIDEIGENCYTVVTEDNRLLVEVDLGKVIGLTNEQKNYRICSVPNTDLKYVTAEGSHRVPHHKVHIIVYRERWCISCKQRMLPSEWTSHGDGSFEIHDECWKHWLKRHPELGEYEPVEDPVYEMEGHVVRKELKE